ncbi:uncharacterized protein LOC142814099 [Rhipicephalus microplus]|uniref:uncharacterized protein LOC142814099 n=1 Tax=Rhipicephalus microplus TaxID=6941 RepID=UPI003F6C5DA9
MTFQCLPRALQYVPRFLPLLLSTRSHHPPDVPPHTRPSLHNNSPCCKAVSSHPVRFVRLFADQSARRLCLYDVRLDNLLQARPSWQASSSRDVNVDQSVPITTPEEKVFLPPIFTISQWNSYGNHGFPHRTAHPWRHSTRGRVTPGYPVTRQRPRKFVQSSLHIAMKQPLSLVLPKR